MLTGLIDAILDRSVVGYSSIGYDLRRWAGALDDLSPGILAGRTAVVTGAGRGLGRQTALDLAALGARVRMVVRDPGRAEGTLAAIRSSLPDADLVLDVCDVSSLRSVRDYASTLESVDVLVHNAGVMPAQRTVTEEGHEACLATHVLGPHLMTRLSLPALRSASGIARVIWVSSGGMYTQRLDLDDIEYSRGPYRPTSAYARTKRMQVALAREWAERVAEDSIAVHSCHPGWADTPGVADSLPAFRRTVSPFLRTPRQGADTVVWLAAAQDPAARNGMFFHDRRARPEHYLPLTREVRSTRHSLFELCEQLTA